MCRPPLPPASHHPSPEIGAMAGRSRQSGSLSRPGPCTKRERALAARPSNGPAAGSQAAASAGSIKLAALRAVGLAYVGFATRHPSHFRVMFGREVADRSAHPDLREAAGAAFELLADAVGQCQRAGLVREGASRALAVSAWAMVHGLADLVVNRQLGVDARSHEELANDVTADLFLGLGSRNP